MIPLVVFKNPFLSWVLTSALFYSALFWGIYTGIVEHVIAADFTHIAAIILGMLVYCNLSLGLMSLKLQQMIMQGEVDETESSYFYTQFDNIGLFMVAAPTMGLLGTVIGLSRLMEQSATVNLDTIVDLLATGTGAALYPTAMGLVLALVLLFQRHIPMHSFRIHGFAANI